MPGYELVGKEELFQISKLFKGDKVNLYRYGEGNSTVREFEQKFADFMGVKYAHAVSSGTAAIHCALAGCGITKGDEVITTSFTFVAPIEAILSVGATPIPVEIDETYHLDPEEIKKSITNKTKAILSVPMWESPKMDKILSICRDFNLKLIEDSAQCLGGVFNNQKLGTFGEIGTFSFDMGKSLTVGEGGMIISNNKDLYDRVAEFSDHGHMHLEDVPRGQDPRRSPGLNYRMSELSGAVGLAQIDKLTSLLERQQKNIQNIMSGISDIDICIRPIVNHSIGTGDTLIFSFKSAELVSAFIKNFSDHGFSSKILPDAMDWHFAGSWNHIFSPANGYSQDLISHWPKTFSLLSRSIAIPIHYNMSDEYSLELVKAIRKSMPNKIRY